MPRQLFSLRLFQLCNAFRDGEVLLSAVLANDEETARFIELGVRSNLKVREVGELSLAPLMEADDLLDECLIVSLKFVSILFQVKN